MGLETHQGTRALRHDVTRPASSRSRTRRIANRSSTRSVKSAPAAAEKGVTIAFETGQETADLLRLTLDELKCDNLKVNFDPANMLLYDKGDPIRAVEILGAGYSQRSCERRIPTGSSRRLG